MPETNYLDGFYTVRNKNGAETDLQIKDGLVYVLSIWQYNETGKTLEELLAKGKLELVSIYTP